MMENRSFIFAVQGEGRGHLTQAIALYELLRDRGFTVHAMLVGSSNRRELPEFFKRKVHVPVYQFESPNFVTGEKNKSIQMWASILKTMRSLGKYGKSVRLIREVAERYHPDAIINFYEPLVGFYGLRYKKDIRIISIAHQYIYLHPEFNFPKGKLVDRFCIKHYTRLSAMRSDALLALSFYGLGNSRNHKLKVIPPLLRREVFEQEIHQQPFVLAYLLNAGYMQDIINWHKLHPTVELHCFTDSKAVKGKWRYDDTLCFHSLDDKKFLAMMASCKGLVCTAGFESVCEARYLGKPVLMVPVGGHYEQFCNARDAQKAGAGVYSAAFDIDSLLSFIPEYVPSEEYKEWSRGVEYDVLSVIDSVLPPGSSVVRMNGVEWFKTANL